MPPSYRATFTNDARNVRLARNAIASFAALCGFSSDEVSEIRLAAGEALSNAAEHGRSHRFGGFTVYCQFADGELRIDIRDSGPGFDPAWTSRESPVDRGRGFGMGIMRSLMDTISYSLHGTKVSLVRRMPRDRYEQQHAFVERGEA